MLKRTDSKDKDFIDLIPLLDAGLKINDGDEHDFYNQFNQLDDIKYVIVAYNGVNPIGCGAIKQNDDHSMEIKRMFVRAENRELGTAKKILKELEKWTVELGYSRCILETGSKQLAAIHLYQKCGYTRILNYDQYKDVEDSLCFGKQLID